MPRPTSTKSMTHLLSSLRATSSSPSSSRLSSLPLPVRSISTTTPIFHPAKSSLSARPRPPRLPKADQEEFDRLIAEASNISATVRSLPTPASSSSSSTSQATASSSSSSSSPTSSLSQPEKQAEPDLHKDIRRGAPPEFEGEINPRTGEVGGPKRDPFGAGTGDWQYGGRVTDF